MEKERCRIGIVLVAVLLSLTCSLTAFGAERVEIGFTQSEAKQVYAYDMSKTPPLQVGFVNGNLWYYMPVEDMRAGDFDGDGLDEVAILLDDRTAIDVVDPETGSMIGGIAYQNWGYFPIIDFTVGDINGDKKDEVVVLTNSDTWWTSKSDKGGWDIRAYDVTTSPATLVARMDLFTWFPGQPDAPVLEIATGDFNKDGKDEVVFMTPTTWHNPDAGSLLIFAYDITTSPPTQRGYMNAKAWYWDAFTNLRVGDFNGDGKADICFNQAGNKQIWAYDITTSPATQLGYLSASGWYWNLFDNLSVGDFNGDGKSDVCFTQDSGKLIHAYDITTSPATQIGFMTAAAWYWNIFENLVAGNFKSVVDDDNDGYPVEDDCNDNDARVNVPGNADTTALAADFIAQCEGATNRKGKNTHGQEVSCVAHLANELLEAGCINDEEHSEIVSAAAKNK